MTRKEDIKLELAILKAKYKSLLREFKKLDGENDNDELEWEDEEENEKERVTFHSPSYYINNLTDRQRHYHSR